MDILHLREYCLAKKAVTEDTPFDEVTLVFKVAGKMFCLCNIEKFVSVNLKCDPEKAIELREQYIAVKPGYHMSKKHWNTIDFGIDASTSEILQWVDESYNLVVKGLTKKLRSELDLT